ncbi:MAG: hypothetical protein M1825_003365 [Sarcosagium campestre]|nr:MAG: hypothetical protein M1825_003365 [Sarcosagium campestre]
MSDAVVTSYLRQRDSILKLPRQILGVFDGADKSCGFDRVISQIQYPPQGKIYIEGNPEGENFRHRREEASCGVPATTASQVQRSINGPCYGEPNNRNAVKWLNDPAIRKAIHADRSQKAYEACNATIQATLTKELVQPPTYFILPRILQQIPVHVYSGDLDFMVNHIGTELVIQNMTWNGKQGLQCEPLTPFIVRGRQVGTWGSERGLSYYLFHGAGHAVPHDAPEAAFAFVRDFVLQDKG